MGLPFSSAGQGDFGKQVLNLFRDHVTQILSLPVVIRNHVVKIHDFYQKMNISVQSLKTLKKLSTVGGLVRMTLDKPECFKSDFFRTDDEWRGWSFLKVVGALRKWIFRNPLRTDEGANKLRPKDNTKPFRFRKNRGFQTQTKTQKSCVYCNKDDKQVLLQLYNCSGNCYTAAKCKSLVVCQVCVGHHHTSICEK